MKQIHKQSIILVLFVAVISTTSFHFTIFNDNYCCFDKRIERKLAWCFHMLKFENEYVTDIVRSVRYLELLTGIETVMKGEYCTGEYFWPDDESWNNDINKWKSWYRQNYCNLTISYCDSIVISKLKVIENAEKWNEKHYQNCLTDYSTDTSYISLIQKHYNNPKITWLFDNWRYRKSDGLDTLANNIMGYMRGIPAQFCEFFNPGEFSHLMHSLNADKRLFSKNSISCYSCGSVFFIHLKNRNAILFTNQVPYDLSELCYLYTESYIKEDSSVFVLQPNWYAFKRFDMSFYESKNEF